MTLMEIAKQLRAVRAEPIPSKKRDPEAYKDRHRRITYLKRKLGRQFEAVKDNNNE